MGEWKEYKLGELVEITNGFAFKSEKFLSIKTDDSLPVIKIKNVANGDVHLNDCMFYKYDESLKKYIIDKNDILIALTGNHPEVMTQVVGEASRYKLEVKALLNQRVAKIEARKNLDDDFLYYFLKDDSTHDYLASQSGGSANQANISKGNIEDLTINCPSLIEQRAIASILSSLDDKIELLHRQNKILEQLAETLFRQWFVEAADESWEKTKIGKVLHTELGGTPSTVIPEYWDGDVPWINSGEINEFRIVKATRFITKLGLEKSNTKLMPKGTTVLAITGATLGQISLLEIETCANQSVVGIIPNARIPKEYVFLWTKQKIEDIIQNETGGAQPHINKNDINETEIIIPPEDLLKEKNRILNEYFEKITINTFQIRTLTQLRDTLLPKLMSGEVRVSL